MMTVQSAMSAKKVVGIVQPTSQAGVAPGASLTYVLPAAGTYQEYPKWLAAAPPLAPVLVYNADQEAEYRAKGYGAPDTSDPHAFLVAKATAKMDDAINLMNRRVDEKLDEQFKAMRAWFSAELTKNWKAHLAEIEDLERRLREFVCDNAPVNVHVESGLAHLSEELDKRDRLHVAELEALDAYLGEELDKRDRMRVAELVALNRQLRAFVVDALKSRKGNVADDNAAIRKAMPSNDFIGALLRDYEPPV